MTDQYFKHTPQALSDHNQVENLAIEVEEAFLNVEKDLWSNTVNAASLGSSIGDLDTYYLKEYLPNNGIIFNYSQKLYFPLHSKEASLDLIPDTATSSLNTVSISNMLMPSQVYTYKHNGLLETEYDFTFVNRKVVLGASPSDARTLTISYNGYEPVDSRDVGLDLRYNVLQTVVNGSVVKTFSNVKTGSTYRIDGYDFKNMCSKDIINVINNAPYNLDKFVSITDVDSEVSYSISNIVITNSYISFESDDVIPENVKIYVANSNLGKLVEGIYRLFYSHNHGSDGGKLVSHSDLVGLFNNNSDIKYSVTNKENYDHPQYINREGYIEDPSVYNNALLGDLLVASSDPSNFYNNLSKDSFKLVFGEYASGHRMGYSKNTDSLVIDSLSRDGVKLVSPKNKNIFSLNEHNFTDLSDGIYSGVRLSIVPTDVGSTGEVAVFSIKKSEIDDVGAVTHTDTAELHVYSSTFSITKIKDSLNVLDSAVINFGTNPKVRIKSESTGIRVEDLTQNKNQQFYIDLPLVTSQITADHIDAKEIHITDTQTLVLGDKNHTEDSDKQTLSFNTTTNQTVLNINKPLLFKRNGYESGIAFGPSSRIFASTSQGLNTAIESEKLDTYIQNNGDVYFIDSGFTYQTGSTNLQAVGRSKIHTNEVTANNFSVNYNESAIRAFKLNGDTHKIFAQRDTQGNTSVLLQSLGGVNVVSGYSISGSDVTLSYGVVRASEFRIEGNAAGAGFYGNVIIPAGNTLTVNGNAIINTALELNTNLTVRGVSNLNILETNSVDAKTLSAETSVTTPLITAPLGFESKLYIGSDTVFNNSATFKQVCTFTSNCVFDTTISANTVNAVNLNVTSAVTFPQVTASGVTVTNNLEFKRMLQTDNTITSEFAGPLQLKAGLTVDRNYTIRLGSADILTTRNTAGLLLSENAVKLGNNSTVKATKMFANKGIPTGGNSDIIGGYAFETNLGSTDGDTGLFCTDKGTASLADDLVFYIDGVKRGEISSTPLDVTGSIEGREKTLVTAEMIKNQMDTLLGTVLSMVYPVGSIYVNGSDNRNPREVLNWPTSVWARFAVGMTLIGAEGSSASEKMAAMWNKPTDMPLSIEEEFGEFKHQLQKNEMPKHAHEFPGDDHLTAFGISKLREQRVYDAHSELTGDFSSGWYNTGESGGDVPHNNVQPSKVVAMWRRIG